MSGEDILTALKDFVVQTDQFRRLLDIALRSRTIKGSDILHRTALRKRLSIKTETVKQGLKERLLASSARKSLTFDGWTSGNMTSYLAVTVHWVDAQWNMTSDLLDFVQLYSHSGENLADAIYKSIKEYGIENQLFLLTSDNASVNDRAVKDLCRMLREKDGVILDSRVARGRCFSHAIGVAQGHLLKGIGSSIEPVLEVETGATVLSSAQRLVDDDESVDKLSVAVRTGSSQGEALDGEVLLTKLRTVTVKVRSCPSAYQYFLTCCNRMNVDPLMLRPYCPTRWQSRYEVLTRCFRVQKGYNVFASSADHSDEMPSSTKKDGYWGKFAVSTEEWALLRKMHEVMGFAVELPQFFGGETYPTISLVLPLLRTLRNQWAAFKDSKSTPPILVPAIEAGIQSVEKYYDMAMDSKTAIIATCLNSYIRDEWFATEIDPARHGEVREMLENAYNRYASSMPPTSVTVPAVAPDIDAADKGERILQQLRAEKIRRKQEQMRNGTSELDKYLGENCPIAPPNFADQGRSILAWWKDNEGESPILAKMAKDYFGAQASSVSCERMFSATKLTDDDRRQSMKPEAFSALQRLKYHSVVKARLKEAEAAESAMLIDDAYHEDGIRSRKRTAEGSVDTVAAKKTKVDMCSTLRIHR